MDINNWIIDLADGFKGFTQSYTYLDDTGRELVAYRDNVTLKEHLAANPGLSVVSGDELDVLVANHNKTLVTEPSQITEADFWEMLEVLPPENWCRDGGFEHFRMCEYYSGSITNQYACSNGRYLTKRIDTADRDTWIKMADFATYCED